MRLRKCLWIGCTDAAETALHARGAWIYICDYHWKYLRSWKR